MIASFFGTRAGFSADASLVAMVLAAVLLTIGWRLAVGRRYEAHRWVQTAAVCLNAVPVVAWMVRSFWRFVVPGLPGDLSKGVDALTTIHAIVGASGAALGVFIIIRGNQLAAKGLSLASYKTPMRIAYIAYMLATLLGVSVYVALYG